jgi:hypothetical protein
MWRHQTTLFAVKEEPMGAKDQKNGNDNGNQDDSDVKATPDVPDPSRRSFVKGMASATLAAGALGKAILLPACDDDGPPAGPVDAGMQMPDGAVTTPDMMAGRTSLKILHSTHYVPAYNDWLKAQAKLWGDANNVDVTFDFLTSSAEVLRVRDMEIAGTAPRHDLWYLVVPPSDVEQQVEDLKDLHTTLETALGPQTAVARNSGYNPHTKKHYGLCVGYWSDPSMYLKSLWSAPGVDMPAGPVTWTDLLVAGEKIKNNTAVAPSGDAGAGSPGRIIGIGLNHLGGKHPGHEWDADAESALFGLLLAFGGMIQDENSQLVIHRPGVREKVEASLDFMRQLYVKTMTENVCSWVPRSNNNALMGASGMATWLEYPIAKASYIQNAMSVYRSAQDGDAAAKAIAEDIHFGPALKGPDSWNGVTLTPKAITPAQGFSIYAVPSFSANKDKAKDFIKFIAMKHSEATYTTKLYNHPAFPNAVPLLNDWYEMDPISPVPNDKLKVFQSVNTWSVSFGHPGPANAAIGEMVNRSIITEMYGRAAAGTYADGAWGNPQAPAAIVDWAFGELKTIYMKWAAAGLIPAQMYLG